MPNFLTEKFGPLPGWVWVVGGVGGFFLLTGGLGRILGTTGAVFEAGPVGSGIGPEGSGAGSGVASEVNDLQNTVTHLQQQLAGEDQIIAQLTQSMNSNASQYQASLDQLAKQGSAELEAVKSTASAQIASLQAAMQAAINSTQAKDQAQLQQTISGYNEKLNTLQALVQALQGQLANQHAPVTTNIPPSPTPQTSGLAYFGNSGYGPYFRGPNLGTSNLPSWAGEALNYFLRSDTATGIATNANEATPEAYAQLNQLINQGYVGRTPGYTGYRPV